MPSLGEGDGGEGLEPRPTVGEPKTAHGARTHVYLGSKPCGCGVAVVVDGENKREVAKSVASFLRDGLKVERLPMDGWQKTFRRCTCDEQPNLLAAGSPTRETGQ